VQTSVFLQDSNARYTFGLFQGRVLVMVILTCRMGSIMCPVPRFVVCRFGSIEACYECCVHSVIAVAGYAVWLQFTATYTTPRQRQNCRFRLHSLRIYELHFHTSVQT